MPTPLKRHRRVSLRQCALHNSYYAKELIKSKHQISRLTERIRELEKEKIRYIEQAVSANKHAAEEARRAADEASRVDGILQFGFEEETIKADIKKLQKERNRLGKQVLHLEQVIQQIKYKIHHIKKQDTNHQIRKQND